MFQEEGELLKRYALAKQAGFQVYYGYPVEVMFYHVPTPLPYATGTIGLVLSV
jgi:hypothetical protein